MLSYVQYKNAVYTELQEQMTEQEYEQSIASRTTVIDKIIMDEHDRPSMDRLSPSDVADSVIKEFNIG